MVCLCDDDVIIGGDVFVCKYMCVYALYIHVCVRARFHLCLMYNDSLQALYLSSSF